MKWILSFMFCAIAAILPWRMRKWFIAALAAWAQATYFLYSSLVKFLLKKLGGERQSP